MRIGLKLLLFILSSTLWPAAQAQSSNSRDSVFRYHWIRNDRTYIEFFSREALVPFYQKWNNESRIVIAHIGDSHVQPDISTSRLREFAQQEKGPGGFSMLLPYTLAGLHAGGGYRTQSEGNWQGARNTELTPRLPLGVGGVTVRSTEPKASITFSFRNPLDSGYRRLRIFCRRNTESFDLKIISGLDTIPVEVAGNDNLPLEVTLPKAPMQFTLSLFKQNEQQSEFELYGMTLDATSQKGASVHALGVAGARWSSILLESLFEPQMKSIDPNLVILDLGTNDYVVGNRIPADMEVQIVDVIRKVKAAVPQATIVLTSAQDMNRRKMNISAGRPFARLMRKIAADEGCALFDWYWISGGPKTMKDWVSNGLAQRDNIHLTAAGYKLKGDLLTAAFRNTFQKLRDHPALETLSLEPDSIPLPQLMARENNRKVPAAPSEYQRDKSVSGNLIYHRIRNGESLGSIAQRYKVSVHSIQQLNGLSGTRIYAGKQLKIVTKSAAKPVAGKQPKTESKDPVKEKTSTATNKSANGKVVKHTIESGETLYSIAKKYQVSVETIKETNKLKSSQIKAGNTLLIELPNGKDGKNKT